MVNNIQDLTINCGTQIKDGIKSKNNPTCMWTNEEHAIRKF